MKTIFAKALLSASILITGAVHSQVSTGLSTVNQLENHWVDSVYRSLDSRERIGQLIMVRANYPGKSFDGKISGYIKNYNIGGVVFFRGNSIEQALQTNYWQEISKTPLFIAMDAEWGLGMRLNDVISFPYQMTLGAINNDSLIYQMGHAIGDQCKRLGIHINFAPVVDINSNPKNPVIGMRSFGEDKHEVARKGIAYMQGLQDAGIIATAKHFPGHGDTDTDSHLTLPVITHEKTRIDTLELFPFKELINNGVSGIMTAHLFLPAYEEGNMIPSTLSSEIVRGLLKEDLGFKGLIITDALDMKGVTEYHDKDNIAVEALLAGNDILLLPENVPHAIRKIQQAIADNIISETFIEERCKKILHYKYRSGLNNYQPVDTANLLKDLNKSGYSFLKHQLFRESLTLVNNENNIIPLRKLDTLNIAAITFGSKDLSTFLKTLGLYTPLKEYSFSSSISSVDTNKLKQELKPYNLLIIGLRGNIYAQDYGIDAEIWELINELGTKHKIILDIFASPYALAKASISGQKDAILLSYQGDEVAQHVSAQVIFGGFPAKGQLPVTASEFFPHGAGIQTKRTRLAYSGPEEFNLDPVVLNRADSIIEDAISKKAMPGCQVMAAKDGIVFYKKTFGYHTYDNQRLVTPEDLYDLASLTKIAATTPTVIKLQEDGLIDIDQKISKYLYYLKNTNKKDIVIRDILAHQARLRPWIPYFKSVIIDDMPDPELFSKIPDEDHPIRVAEGVYLLKDYAYAIYDSIRFSELRDDHEYKYSDIGFYLLVEVFKNITNQPFNLFTDKNFYQPLGLSTMGFLPRKRFSLERIVPTEMDMVFRHQLLQGDVHDQGAALLGGISGHAGLFSNANDMAIIMQMYLQNGCYGGDTILDSALINEFTRRQFPLNGNRRGLGFDKPLPEYEEDGPTCKRASEKSFGHSGFTGTYAWADPEYGLVYIFLANSIHPSSDNRKLSEMNIRTRVHQVFYDAILNNKTSNEP